MAMGALTAGVVSGLLPLLVGIWKNRISTGITGFIVCVMLGLFSGIVMAGPAAVVLTLPILVGDIFDRWRKSVAPPPDRPATGLETAVWIGTTPILGGRAAPILAPPPSGPLQHCSSCNHEFAGVGGSLPPWCPRCGADLKKAVAVSALAEPEA